MLGGYKEIDTAMINSWDTHTHTNTLLEFNTLKHAANYTFHSLAVKHYIFTSSTQYHCAFRVTSVVRDDCFSKCRQLCLCNGDAVCLLCGRI